MKRPFGTVHLCVPSTSTSVATQQMQCPIAVRAPLRLSPLLDLGAEPGGGGRGRWAVRWVCT